MVGALTGAFAAYLLIVAGAVASPAEIGSSCAADGSRPDSTWVGKSVSGPPDQPFVTYGVITRWRVQVGPGLGPLVQQLVTFHGVAEQEKRKVGESAVETVTAGVNEFPTRIPIREYEQIGLHGPSETLFCSGQEGSTADVVDGAWPLGEVRQTQVEIGFATPVTVAIEPDADEDGYGDETQDGCPASPLYVGECPLPVTLAVKRRVRKRSILLKVRASGEATVDAYGQVGWNFKPKRKRVHRRKRSGHASKRRGPRLIVGLDGGKKDVAPGAVTRFTIRLPKPVLLRLSRLNRRESVRAKLTLRATNPAGIAKNTRLRVKLRGWRPVR